jgi:hypothetical protein
VSQQIEINKSLLVQPSVIPFDLSSLSILITFSDTTMTAEAVLTRQVEISFLDARALCNEAKLGLGVVGHPSSEQEVLLVEEAKMLFRALPEETQRAMITLKHNADAVKLANGSLSSRRPPPSCAGTEEDSVFLSSDMSNLSEASPSSRKFKLWPLR